MFRWIKENPESAVTVLGTLVLCLDVGTTGGSNISFGPVGNAIGIAAISVSIVLALQRIKRGQQKLEQEIQLLQEGTQQAFKNSSQQVGEASDRLGTEIKKATSTWIRGQIFGEALWTVFSAASQASVADHSLFSSVSKLFGSLVTNYAPELADSIERLARDQFVEVRITDRAPILELLSDIATQMPDNGVWLGLSRLQNPAAWNYGTEVPARWNQTLQDKVRQKKIHVVRLWALEREDSLDPMREEMRRQQCSGIKVKVLDSDAYRRLQTRAADLSLIWIPDDLDAHLDPERLYGDPIGELQRAGYRPMRALEFETRAGVFLEGVRILDKLGTERRHADFAACWSAASAVT
jgi:hypothetical protein